MDNTLTQLQTALGQVITDEGVLQQAVSAAQSVISQSSGAGTDVNDGIVQQVVAALTSNGYTVTAPNDQSAGTTSAGTSATDTASTGNGTGTATNADANATS